MVIPCPLLVNLMVFLEQQKTAINEQPDDDGHVQISRQLGPIRRWSKKTRAFLQTIQSDGTGELEENIEGQDIRGLTSNLEFYLRLKEGLSVKNDAKSKAIHKWHDAYVVPLRNLTLFVYIVVIPFIECPNWCFKKNK